VQNALVAKCYGATGTVSSIRAIAAPSYGIFTAMIYRGISWPWRYWYRHL